MVRTNTSTRQKSIFTRLTVALTIGPAVLVVLIGLWASYDIARNLRAELINQINDDIASLTEIYIRDGQQSLLRAVEQREALSPINRSGASYLLMNASGRTLGGTLSLPRNTPLDNTQAVTQDISGRTLTMRATQFRGGERIVVARDHNAIKRALSVNAWRFAFAIIALLVLSFTMAKAFGCDLKYRIDAMNTVFRDVGDGQLDKRLPPDCQNDELSLLGQHINAMLARTERILKLRKRVTDQLAHEIRTPLTRLDNSLQNLPTSEKADTAREQLRRCVDMLDGLLDISALDAQYGDRRGFQNFDLNAHISALVELFSPVAEEDGKRLFWAAHDTPVMVAGDPAQIGRLLSNLIENALKYSDEKSDISISLTRDDTAFLGHAIVRVSNVGPSISEQTAKEIFTPFYRAPDLTDSKGYGLGLALCRSIAARHNGQIDVERHPRRTVFRFNLPYIQ